MIAGTGPSAAAGGFPWPWDDPLFPGIQRGGAYYTFHCRQCLVGWSGSRHCWVCGGEWKPMTVFQATWIG